MPEYISHLLFFMLFVSSQIDMAGQWRLLSSHGGPEIVCLIAPVSIKDPPPKLVPNAHHRHE